jgi:hypothetical protein
MRLTPPQATPAPVAVQIPTPPVPPTPPAVLAPAFPGQFGQFGGFRVPQSPQEVAILEAQRARLSQQIINVRDQRQTIARQYERSSGASRAGLEQKLQSIDQRLIQLQNDLSESGRALYQSRVGGTIMDGGGNGFPGPFGKMNPGQVTAISIVFIVAFLGPLAASFGRMVWRRAKPTVPPGWNDSAQRLERLEQAVDTIAIEVERVSEGQRFMTKLMTQNAAAGGAPVNASAGVNGNQPLPALGPGAPPDPVVLQNQRDEVRVRRS